jgi:hypothetical protein
MLNPEIVFVLLMVAMGAVIAGWAWLVWCGGEWAKRKAHAWIEKRIYGGPAPRARDGCDDCGAAVEPSRTWVAKKDGEIVAVADTSRKIVAAIHALGPAGAGVKANWGPPPPSRHQWWCPLIPRLMRVRTQIENGVPLSIAEQRAKETSEGER